jgi:hypothetical protein
VIGVIECLDIFSEPAKVRVIAPDMLLPFRQAVQMRLRLAKIVEDNSISSGIFMEP